MLAVGLYGQRRVKNGLAEAVAPDIKLLNKLMLIEVYVINQQILSLHQNHAKCRTDVRLQRLFVKVLIDTPIIHFKR